MTVDFKGSGGLNFFSSFFAFLSYLLPSSGQNMHYQCFYSYLHLEIWLKTTFFDFLSLSIDSVWFRMLISFSLAILHHNMPSELT